jgi:hypothetical protein
VSRPFNWRSRRCGSNSNLTPQPCRGTASLVRPGFLSTCHTRSAAALENGWKPWSLARSSERQRGWNIGQRPALAPCGAEASGEGGAERQDVKTASRIVVVIRCTQKLLKQMEHSASAPDPSTTRLGNWYVNSLGVGHQRYVLCVSERGRLPVLGAQAALHPAAAARRGAASALNILAAPRLPVD